jgi:hypothetical protein
MQNLDLTKKEHEHKRRTIGGNQQDVEVRKVRAEREYD